MNIKASELRTGNILDYLIEDKLDDRQEWYEPSAVDWQDIKYFAEREAKNKGLVPNGPVREHYKPIPITEDWLVNLGFVQPKDKFDYYKDDLIEVCVQDDTVHVWVLYSVGSAIQVFHIQYIHQLQNLYFSLSGKELELKTPLK